MKNVKTPVKLVSDEKDFSAVLDIITTHRSRALMSVNVESLLTYSSDTFLAILAKYSSHLKRHRNFSQSAVGKSVHRHNPLSRREPHRGRVRHVARDEPGYGGAVQASAYSQGSASADFRGVS